MNTLINMLNVDNLINRVSTFNFTKAVASLLLVGASVISVSMLSSTAAVAADDHPAQDLVVSSTSKLLDVLKTEGERIKTDKAFLDKQIDAYVVPNIDFNTMTKLAVGKSWRKADDKQRVELVEEFRALLLNTYTNALTEYSGESIEFQPFKPEKRDDRAVVRSVFKQSGGSTVPVLYKLRDKEGWLIYDIEVDQISLVTSYRTAFSSEIEKGGIDGLIKTMKDKNAKS